MKTDDAFYLVGEDVAPEPHHYEVSGLDGVYLLNGFTREIVDGEEYVSVKNVSGLHSAIGKHIVLTRKGICPAEIRFLRKALDLTQSELAAKLGNDAQSVARWEKGVCEMPGMAEKLLRAVFLAQHATNATDLDTLRRLLVSLMDELDLVDEVRSAQASFTLGDRWEEATKVAA